MGGGASHLTDQQKKQIEKETPFDTKDINKLLKRYSMYDNSDGGKNGIPLKTLLTIPEYLDHPLISRIVELYADVDKQKIYPEKFIYLCAALSAKAEIQQKRSMAFKTLDLEGSGQLQYQDMFVFYKSLFARTLSDDQILALTHRALTLPELTTLGSITQKDFDTMVPDSEIVSRFTIDLQLP